MYGLGRRLAEEIELEVVRMRWGCLRVPASRRSQVAALRFHASANTIREATHRLRAVGFLDLTTPGLWTVPLAALGVDSLRDCGFLAAPIGEEGHPCWRSVWMTRRIVATVALSRCARRGVVRDDLHTQLKALHLASSRIAEPCETVDALWMLVHAAVQLAGGRGLQSILNTLWRSWEQVRLWEMLAWDWEASALLADDLERGSKRTRRRRSWTRSTASTNARRRECWSRRGPSRSRSARSESRGTSRTCGPSARASGEACRTPRSYSGPARWSRARAWSTGTTERRPSRASSRRAGAARTPWMPRSMMMGSAKTSSGSSNEKPRPPLTPSACHPGCSTTTASAGARAWAGSRRRRGRRSAR